jgi:hypothetical protein
MHYRSTVDDTDQPVVFSMPTLPQGSETLPCIVYSHDVLEPATRDRFIDFSLREAHRWLASLRDSPEPVCLLQPMSRANAEAIGLGGRDLFDAIAAVEQDQRVKLGPVYGAGVGAGGTKTLQWACWFPNRFEAIAVAGAVVDERIDQCDERESAPWEASAKESLRPSSLLGNLAGMPIFVEHPWWFDGVGGTTSPRQYEELVRLLEGPDFQVTSRRELPILLSGTDWPTNPAELVAWFRSARRLEPKRKVFIAYSERSDGRGVRLIKPAQPGKPATIKRQEKEDVVSIQTSGCAEIGVEVLSDKPIRLDRRRYPVEAGSTSSNAGRTWIRFQHRGDRWQKISATEPFDHQASGGPIMQMRWDGIVFVPGTLGDDLETRTLRRVAEELQKRWTLGEDVPAVDETNHAAVVRYDIVADGEITDDMMSRRHVVVIGSPRSNLLLARYHGRLGCEWPAPSEMNDGSIDPFRFRGETYAQRSAGMVLLGPHPEFTGRYFFVITGTSADSIAQATRLRLHLSPDFVIWEGATVSGFGYERVAGV